jgi:hypothetical protein
MNRKSKDVTLGITVPNSNWKIAEAEITSMHLAHISVVLTLPACYTHICGAHSPSLLHTYLRCSLSQLVTHISAVLTLPACYTHICGADSASLLHTYMWCSLSQLVTHISVVLTLPACYTHICGAHSPSLLHTYPRCSLSQLVTHISVLLTLPVGRVSITDMCVTSWESEHHIYVCNKLGE